MERWKGGKVERWKKERLKEERGMKKGWVDER